MSKSGRPGLGDVRRALRVVGECRDLGYDPGAWRPHACRGLAGLVGARVVSGMECKWRPEGPVVPVGFHQVGLTPDEHERYFVPFFRRGAPDHELLFAPLQAAVGPHLVRTRRQDVPTGSGTGAGCTSSTTGRSGSTSAPRRCGGCRAGGPT